MPAAVSTNIPEPADPDILACLEDVIDPEVGLSIVDLGLVYRTSRGPDGIVVDLTLTSRACPLGEMIAADARERLERAFQDGAAVHVNLVWEPTWTPARITERGIGLLGGPARRG